MLSADGGRDGSVPPTAPGSGGNVRYPGSLRHGVAGRFAGEAATEGGSKIHSELNAWVLGGQA